MKVLKRMAVLAGIAALGWAGPTSAKGTFDSEAIWKQIKGHLHDLHREYQAWQRIDRGFSAARRELTRSIDPTSAKGTFDSEVIWKAITGRLHDLQEGLQRTPTDLSGIDRLLDPDFKGVPLQPKGEKVLRDHGGLRVTRSEPRTAGAVGPEEFSRSFRTYVSEFRHISRIHFQVVHIELIPGAAGRARVWCNHEMIGTSLDGKTLEKGGQWEVEWQRRSKSELWKMLRLTVRSQSTIQSPHKLFSDRTASAVGSIPSYRNQVQAGVDHWQSSMDGAFRHDLMFNHGLALGDLDGDGWDDIFICQPSGLPNRLYRNLGNGTFEDITERSGVGILDDTAAGLIVDIDNDGDQDLLAVLATGGGLLFRNEGNLKFQFDEEAFDPPEKPSGVFTGISAADYDRDGLLDVYLQSYNPGKPSEFQPLPVLDARNGGANTLYRNHGGLAFKNVTLGAGLDMNNRRFSYAAVWEDFDSDGWPDIYVANDWGLNNLYRNRGNGTFEDVAEKAGVLDLGAGMGVAWLDYDRDGLMDLHVSNMWSSAGRRISNQPGFAPGASEEDLRKLKRFHRGNSLFRNRGDGTFEDVTGTARISRGHWAWACANLDADNDGYEDLLVVNGWVTGKKPDDL